MSVLVGHDRRAVLVSAHLGRPVALAHSAVVDELGGLGWVALVRPCPGGLELILTAGGKREALRQWHAMWWMRWRDAAHRIVNRKAASVEARVELNRRARRARERASAAFDRMTTMTDGTPEVDRAG